MLKIVWPFIKAFGLGQARTLAAAIGAMLVSDGVMTSSQTQDFIGSICFLAAVGFQAFDTFVVNKKIQVALATPVPTTQGEK